MFAQMFNKRMIGLLSGSLLLALGAANSRAGLTAYYSFDDSSNAPSSLGTDDSGNGLNLTAVGTPSAATGETAGAASFSAGSYFTQTASNIYSATPTFSVSFDVDPSQTTSDNYISASSAKASPAFLIQSKEFKVFYYPNPSTADDIATSVQATAGTFANLAFTFQATDGQGAGATSYTGTGTLYVNGAVAASTTSFVYVPGGTTLGIGGKAGNPGDPFTGLLDEFAVYNMVLTSTQISDLAAGQTPLQVTAPEPGCLALFGLGGLLWRRRRR